MQSQLLDSAKKLFQAGVDQSRQGDYRQAIETFNQALCLNPNDADAYGHRCVARYKLGEQQGAIADCQRAATLYLNQEKVKEYQYSLNMLKKLRGLAANGDAPDGG